MAQGLSRAHSSRTIRGRDSISFKGVDGPRLQVAYLMRETVRYSAYAVKREAKAVFSVERPDALGSILADGPQETFVISGIETVGIIVTFCDVLTQTPLAKPAGQRPIKSLTFTVKRPQFG